MVLNNGSWLLFRFSGTEPKVRVYSESSVEKESLQLIDDGKKILGLN